jgi:hypothetical protein
MASLARKIVRFSGHFTARSANAKASGESPDATGESPVLPIAMGVFFLPYGCPANLNKNNSAAFSSA